MVVDYSEGMRQAMECFRRAGRTRPAFVAGIEEWLMPTDMRIACFRRNAEKYGFEYDSRRIL